MTSNAHGRSRSNAKPSPSTFLRIAAGTLTTPASPHTTGLSKSMTPISSSEGLLRTCTSELRLQTVLSGWRDLCRARHSHLVAAIFRRHHNSDRILTTRLAYPRDAVRILAGSRHRVLADCNTQLDRAASAPGWAFGGLGPGMDCRSRSCLVFLDNRCSRRRRN